MILNSNSSSNFQLASSETSTTSPVWKHPVPPQELLSELKEESYMDLLEESKKTDELVYDVPEYVESVAHTKNKSDQAGLEDTTM